MSKSGDREANKGLPNEPASLLPLDQTPPGLPAEMVPPDFQSLLLSPLIKDPLPGDFDVAKEVPHLTNLWKTDHDLRAYDLQQFVHAGGSGMVFRAVDSASRTVALKIARQKLFSVAPTTPGVAATLSPVAPRELRALERVAHSNLVRLYDTLGTTERVFAISTSYVSEPQPIDRYISNTLAKRGSGRPAAFSAQRLDGACEFLVKRCAEIASALAHMHHQRLFHCDVKPANVLIGKDGVAVLTDMGASVHPDDVDADGKLRLQFTWTYAHPELTSLVNDPRSISGGGLKASTRVSIGSGLARFDLFALGRTLQEVLAVLAREFGERTYATYNFRFLHLVSALLLDGRNAPLDDRVRPQDGRHFIKDAALDYPVDLFGRLKIGSAADLLTTLDRFSRSFSWSGLLPELDRWQKDVINTGVGEATPFSPRVARLFRHPTLRRLRNEAQLGWMKEVYAGATHTRWSHSLGVCAATADYYSALLADPDIPTARVVLKGQDVAHALVAAALHDLGQTAFGHDFEEACPGFFRHEEIVRRLLEDAQFGRPTLKELITEAWPSVDLERVFAILGNADPKGDVNLATPADGLARDVISGPIDADKYDYLLRDSTGCGVPYGAAIDRRRFLRALTVDTRTAGGRSRLALAYRTKGAAAVESLLLARYQMFGGVYWHHSFRCIQAMFTHAVAATFRDLDKATIRPRPDVRISSSALREFFYQRVICGNTLGRCQEILKQRSVPEVCYLDPPPELVGERALEFVWKFASDPNRELVMRLARRHLFKRIFERRVADLGEDADYSALASELAPHRRVAQALDLEKRLMDSIYRRMQEMGERAESVAENDARDQYQRLAGFGFPKVVIDFPTRGIPEERNFPNQLADPARKYISGSGQGRVDQRSVFAVVKRLQTDMATVRVFTAPELHDLVVRYLDLNDVEACVESVVPRLELRR